MTAVWDGLMAAASGDAQPDYSGSCMIALYPPADVAEKLAVPGGLPPAEMHLTVAYTGDAADVEARTLADAAQSLAHRLPVEATVSGHARFTGGDDGDAIVALVDSPALDTLRRDAETALAARGLQLPSEHGFTTLCYADPGDPDPVGRVEALPVTFGAITATHGTERTTYPFDRPAAGWAGLRQAVTR